MFGTTTLEMVGGRLIEETRGIVSHRHAELLLSEVDSAELLVKPNPAVLGASIALTPFFGVGLLILPFYFIMKYKFLIFHSGSNATVVAIKGSEDPFHDFMDAVLTAAAKAKRH
jgi:VIT1/CCC1 family predicted Fe2+/Mn2+ transporter